MVTAAELLAGSMTEVDQVLTINWETRTIDIPKTVTNLGVEYDDDTKHLTFKAPRYYYGVDLSDFNVAIGYWNADDEPDVYTPDNIECGEEFLAFTWVVGPHAYTKSGDVTFLVYAYTGQPGDDDKITRRISTTLHVLPVLKGGNPEQAFVEQHYDAITAAVMEALQMAQDTDLKGEPGYTPVKGIDYFTEEERNEFADQIVRDHNGAFANALRGAVSGEVIRVDDVSPIEHAVKARVGGKNLFDISKIPVTSASVSSACVSEIGEDYVIISTLEGYTGNGYCTVPVKVKEACPGLIVGRTYTLNADTESDSSNIYLPGVQKSWVFGTSKVMTEEILDSTMTLYGFSMGSGLGPGECRISNIQIEEGSVATEYEPYIDPTSVNVTACGKNMLPYPYDNMTKTLKGVTITENSDGTFVANGTATGECVYFLLDKGTRYYKGKYTFSGISGGSPTTYYIQPVIDGVYKDAIFNPTTLELDGRLTRLGFYIKSGTILNNMTFKLQIEKGDAATEYEPYVGSEYTPDTDGLVDIASVAPTMTLVTDTPGVTIEAEYSKDINKQTFGGSGAVTDGISIKDRVTGQSYTLYVSNGKLMME